MMRSSIASLGILALVLVSGCAEGVDAGSEDVGEAEQALLANNSLTYNAITLNAITLNAITLNALDTYNLDEATLDALQDIGQQGTMARMFVQYAVSCAFNSSQTFEFDWTDAYGFGRHEEYQGALAIAPHWATQALGTQGEEMVSACLAARVNWYETPVAISMRAPQGPLSSPPSNELTAYPDVEGAFWGNLWADEPYIYTCYNSTTVANSRSHQRDCAVGHLNPDNSVSECGIIDIIGPCSDHCQPVNGVTGAYASCAKHPGDGTHTLNVVTTALP